MKRTLRRSASRPESQAPLISPTTTGTNNQGKSCADRCSSSSTMRGAEAMNRNNPAKFTELEISNGQNGRSRPNDR